MFSLALPGRRSGGTREYRHYFRATCRSLRLESCRFTPHSLRHGGATYALVHLKQSIETVMLRGRWQAAASCRTYLQAGRARQLDNIIDPSVLSLANQVADDWYSTIHNGLRRQSRGYVVPLRYLVLLSSKCGARCIAATLIVISVLVSEPHFQVGFGMSQCRCFVRQ